jgi:hypothetical protein
MTKRFPGENWVLGVSSYSSIAIERYNEETIALLKQRVKSGVDEIRTQRCKGGVVSSLSGSCGDIQFYVVEVGWQVPSRESYLSDVFKQGSHFKRTSFNVPSFFQLPRMKFTCLRSWESSRLTPHPRYSSFRGVDGHYNRNSVLNLQDKWASQQIGRYVRTYGEKFQIDSILFLDNEVSCVRDSLYRRQIDRGI